MDPNSTKKGPQNFVAFSKTVIIDSMWLKGTIQDSTMILETAQYKAIIELAIKNSVK